MASCANCCNISNVIGYSLHQGVTIVAYATLAISSLKLVATATALALMARGPYNTKPVLGITLVMCMVMFTVSMYQIVISLLLLWQVKIKPNIFLCSLWYLSHLSIVSLYCILIVTRSMVCFALKYYFQAIFTLAIGIVYGATFIYFAVVVNSYLHSLNQDRYL